MHSPDNETFSTPPTTPSMPEFRPSLSRRTSRPSNLHIAHTSSDWTPNLVLDSQQSPEISSGGKARSATPTSTPSTLLNGTKTNGVSVTLEGPPAMSNTPTLTHRTVPNPSHTPPIASPCFLHSKLQSESFMSWLNSTHPAQGHDLRSKEDRQASYADGTVSDSYSDTLSPYADEDEREYAQSLTKQLAETAVTVREWRASW